MASTGTDKRNRGQQGAASRWAVVGLGLVALLGVIGVTAVAQGGSDESEVVTRAEAALERADIDGAKVEERDGVVTVSGVAADQSGRVPDVLAGVEGVDDIKIDATGEASGPVESAKGEGDGADNGDDGTTAEDGDSKDGPEEDQAANDEAEKDGAAADDAAGDLPTDKFLPTPLASGAVLDVPLPKGAERMGVFQGGKVYLVGDVPSFAEGNRRIAAAREILGEDGVINLYKVDSETSTNDDGLIIIAEPFIFPASSAELPESFFGIADIGVAIMERFPNTTLMITGHTDVSGATAMNDQLSQDRADSLKEYIVDEGVESDRITAVGKGDTEPAFPNDTAANRAKNRRIEVTLDGLLQGE